MLMVRYPRLEEHLCGDPNGNRGRSQVEEDATRRDHLRSQSEMTRLSSTTMMVAAGPKSRTAAKTKVSDTDSRAGMVGTRTVKDPLRRVSPAKTNHS